MHQAVLHLHWQILSMKQRIISIIMYMIEARCARNATEKKSEFQLYAEERSLEIMRCFSGQDEVIEFKHTAYSKAVFGKGAVEAAKIPGRKTGRKDMICQM